MGKDNPQISVVMAAYNVGKKEIFDAAIESIVRQDVADWELLICDDASVDQTLQWAKRWQEIEPRIKLLHNAGNKMAGATRNRCVREAKGKYIAIMDDDDLCSSNRLSVQTEFLENNSKYAFVGLKGERFEKQIGDTEDPYWFCEYPESSDFKMTLPFVHASIMFRREALISVGGYREDKAVQRSEDYDLLMRMYAKGMKGANTKKAIYYIREDTNALARRKYRYRIIESKVKFSGFSSLGMMPTALPYAIKPLIVGLLPTKFLAAQKMKYYRRRELSDGNKDGKD